MKKFLQIFGVIAIVLTLIPLIAADFWWIRMFDFPNIQLTILTFVALMTYFIEFNIKYREDYIFVTILAACLIFQVIKIYPYTPAHNFEVGDSTPGVTNENILKFYSANVLQKNTAYDSLVRQINLEDPDVLLLMETDNIWMEKVRPATSKYPYKVEVPLPNTYGMLLYSKLKMINPEKSFLVDDSIPSIHTILELRSGQKIMFHAIHPTPPMPQENPSSTDRDAEMMLVSKMALDVKLPVIVVGDFNDVAWSATSTLFKNAGGLLDVRVGRGFYNSFDVSSFILRWPLDHFFVSEEFRVNNIRTGNSIESDHYPFYIEMTLEPDRAKEQIPAPPTLSQLKRSQHQIDEWRKESNNQKKTVF